MKRVRPLFRCVTLFHLKGCEFACAPPGFVISVDESASVLVGYEYISVISVDESACVLVGYEYISFKSAKIR
jgi:hypothetical protein